LTSYSIRARNHWLACCFSWQIFGKEGSPQPINPSVSQETLAEMVGTTRSRVSHFVNKFHKLGLISYNGHIEVNSSLLSAVLHDKPELKEDE
jgi:CRP-like cAMP-binding protein